MIPWNSHAHISMIIQLNHPSCLAICSQLSFVTSDVALQGPAALDVILLCKGPWCWTLMLLCKGPWRWLDVALQGPTALDVALQGPMALDVALQGPVAVLSSSPEMAASIAKEIMCSSNEFPSGATIARARLRLDVFHCCWRQHRYIQGLLAGQLWFCIMSDASPQGIPYVAHACRGL